MILICELDLDTPKMYLRITNEVSRSELSKVRAQRGQTDTDRQTRPNALPTTFTGGNERNITAKLIY